MRRALLKQIMYVSKVCRCGDDICSPYCSGGHVCSFTYFLAIYAVNSEWLSFIMLSKYMSTAFLLHIIALSRCV